jgi:hypothetical protein
MRKGSDWRFDKTIIVRVESNYYHLEDIIVRILKKEYEDKGNMLLQNIEQFLIQKEIIKDLAYCFTTELFIFPGLRMVT